MDHRRLLPALLAVGLSAGAALWYSQSAPAPPPATLIAAAARADEPITLTVHVTGLVARPGLVSVSDGSRVADAVAAAGGVLPGADLGLVNLAAPLADGQHLVVPEAGSGGGPAAVTAGRVSINTADAAALQQLPGVGPVLAERIIAYRTDHGPFRTVEELIDVPGIGEVKLASLRDGVVVP